MRALIVTDLEGVWGADSIDCLVGGEPAWERARLRATHEVNLAIVGLSRQGFTEFIVSDSHRNGTDEPNLVLGALDSRARYDLRDDAFSPALFHGVSGVAALGMHAAGGVEGFVGHALDVGLAWEAANGRLLSETDFLLGLCADAQVPFLFVSGDDTLAAGLPTGTRAVVTKRSLSRTEARSLELAGVEQALLEAAVAPPRPAAPLPDGPLRLHLVSGAFDVTGSDFLLRDSETSVRIDGGAPRRLYERALNAIEVCGSARDGALTHGPGEPGFIDELSRLLCAPWPSLRRA